MSSMRSRFLWATLSVHGLRKTLAMLAHGVSTARWERAVSPARHPLKAVRRKNRQFRRRVVRSELCSRLRQLHHRTRFRRLNGAPIRDMSVGAALGLPDLALASRKSRAAPL